MIADLGVSAVDFDLIEARSQHCALLRSTYHAEDFEVATHNVIRLDHSGRVSRLVLFDEDALDEARAELDALAQSD